MASTILNFSADDLTKMEQRFRTQLINSITGFKSVALIGTRSKSGQENLAIFNSLVHIGAHPPLVGMFSRPDSVDRHTLDNIRETGVYTINHIQASWADRAHQTSARYPQTVSEFEAVGLHTEYKDEFPAPFVHESSIQLGMRLAEEIPVRLNGTVLLIGQIEHISLPEGCLLSDGFVNIAQAGTIAGSGLDAYYEIENMRRMSYAKPNRWPDILHTNVKASNT